MSSFIRQAETEEELQRIYRFRYGIYIEEMGKPIFQADHAQRQLRDELDDRATQLYVERAGEVVGTVRIIWGSNGIPSAYREWYGLHYFDAFPSAAISFTGRMMVARKHRNSSLAASLAREAYRRGCERGISFDFIHTTSPLVPFFERLGHRRYDDDFIDPELGPRTPMVLLLEDLQHLENQQSPFVTIAREMPNRPEPVEWFKKQFSKDSLV